MNTIRIRTTINEYLQDICIIFVDKPEFYGNNIITLNEKRNDNIKPKTWYLNHTLQEIRNQIEFCNLEPGDYIVMK